jgi:hypothetical protein
MLSNFTIFLFADAELVLPKHWIPDGATSVYIVYLNSRET